MLSRARARIAYKIKDAVFRLGGFQSLIDEKERQLLSHHMGFVHQWDEHRRFQMELLQADGLKPSSRVLEIGCGPLTLGLPLIGFLDPGKYTGIDVRPSVLDIAYAQISKAGLAAKNPRLICSRTFGAEELGAETFDFVWSFSVLFHLTDELVNTWFEQVARRLERTGICIANINAETAESTWLEFPFNRRPPAFYAELAQRYGLTMTERGTLESLGFRLASEENKNHLLTFMHRKSSRASA